MTDTGQPVFDSKTTAVGLRRFSPHRSVPMSRLPSPPAYIHTCFYTNRCVAAAPFIPVVVFLPANHAFLAFASFTLPLTTTV